MATRLVVVSNRLPIVLTQQPDNQWTIQPGSGGLVTALAPVLSHRGGLWIGWPGISDSIPGDWDALLRQGTHQAGYEFRSVMLSEAEVSGFYHGFANAVIWPLFHDLVHRCNFDPAYWYAYLDANRKYADTVAKACTEDDFIWIHDYQLMHVGEFLRGRMPGRHLGFFLHIPFPPLDVFLKLPWRGQILGALLNYDLLGFQTGRDKRNFLHCLQHLLPDIKLSGKGTVVQAVVGERAVNIGNFPISIDYKHFSGKAASTPVEQRLHELRREIGDAAVMLGVDRLDFTKGLPERLRAFDMALERFADLRGRLILLQVVVPSREAVPEYQVLKAEIEQLVGQINGKYSTPGYVPIHYLYRSIPEIDLLALYRLAQIAFITPMKDGMNLVAKEYCACQTDVRGALVLSEFAGAAAQLQRGALLVNPNDIEGMANAVYQAFTLDDNERRARMRKLRETIRKQDIFWWVDQYLRAAFGRRLDEISPVDDDEYLPRMNLQDLHAEFCENGASTRPTSLFSRQRPNKTREKPA